MSAVAKYLQGKVDESLTKFLQPAGLVPAALFVVLNLAFVYPTLKGAQVGLAAAYAGLDETWQTVVAALAVIFLGYVLISVSGTILDLLSGESWRRGWLYDQLVAKARGSLTRRFAQPSLAEPGRIEDLGTAIELRSAYPVTDVRSGEAIEGTRLANVGPTRLSNAIRATHGLVFERYRIDLVALWPQLEASADKDSAAIKATTDAKASLDTLANLTFVLAVFAVEALVLFSARAEWARALLSLFAVPFAYLAYRATVVRARAWGDTIETVVDLFREKLRTSLDLREHKSAKDERDLWWKASKVFLWGRGDTVDADEIFDGQPVAAAATTITASRNVEVAGQVAEPADVPGARAGAERRVAQVVEYGFVLSQKGDRDATDAMIALRDTRVPWIGRVPDVDLTPDEGGPIERTVERRLAPDLLILRIPRMRRGAAVWLGFFLPIWEAVVPEGFTVTGRPNPTPGWTILELVVERDDPQAQNPDLDVFSGAWASTPVLRVRPGDGTTREASPHRGRHRFALDDADLGKTLLIVFNEEVEDGS